MAAGDNRLGPTRRVKSRKDFLRIQSKARKIRTEHFLVAYDFVHNSPSEKARDSRIGVTITTKIDKRATRRNTLRRRVREVFRLCRQDLRQAVDIVVIALGGATELEFSAISEELHSAFGRARLFKGPRSHGTKTSDRRSM